MKNNRIIKNSLGLGIILALTVGFSSSAIAGPGPQYWAQRAKDASENAKKEEAAKPADQSAMACATCKTTDVRESHPSAAGGKVPARSDLVGTKHSCEMCGGAITVVRGETTNDMKANCPMCAKSAPSCCKVNG